ncbi:hypothetical protein O181_081661 [Austropuccinia psidii MF-1]|uniref:Uncharacterized protein n=1 Tax=Austropuccinia psidii MF-1 TaxID=1389203 RepID=A0A9Q3IG62_9BASI|nr:hypothetical protein [Austropuccinia psidii MF-1]
MMLLTAEWRKNNPTPPKQVPKTAPVTRSRNSNVRRCHGKCVSDGHNHDEITKEGGHQIKISELTSDIFDCIPELDDAITDVKSHISNKNPSICNNLKANNLSLSQINEALMCFEAFLREIKTFNNDDTFSIKINEQSAIIKELTVKYSKFNIDYIIETRIQQAINIIKTDNKKVHDDISNKFTEVKTYTIALKKFFYASQEEVSKLSMELNQVTSDITRQTELWKEVTHKDDMYKTEVINFIQAFQHEYRNSQRCSNSKMNDIEQILNTLPRISTPLNQNDGTRI